ncbi:MAG: DUF1501 domain-containing protein [Gammaproteobacteria bacterium]|jgi:uncharacterized protein (DUF1501 family)|nr:DUF1501 domain-containing protein [Gammaproteobacteria bacterium]
MERRSFIKAAAYTSILSSKISWSQQERKNKYLVLIELKGGNDGLNTVIPYSDKLYYSKRPKINIPPKDVIKINSKIGLHPSLNYFAELYQNNEISIIQNVGYHKPNKSHFASIDIWERASRDIRSNGWLYELFRINNPDRLIDSIVFSGSTGFFKGPKSNYIKINSISSFIKEAKLIDITSTNFNATNENQQYLLDSNRLINKVSTELENKIGQTKWKSMANKTPLDRQLTQVSQLMNANIKIPVFKVSIGGFDTHADQGEVHHELLNELDNAVSSFSKYIKKQGLWDNTIVLTYSEFGRRIAENGNNGTDHGEASCMFCIGGNVKGGVFGGKVDLQSTHKDNLIYKVDFKEVYSTLEKKWFKAKHPTLSNTTIDFI